MINILGMNAEKVRVIGECVWGYMSVGSVVSCGFALIYWWAEPAPITVASMATETLNVVRGGTAQVPEATLSVDAKRSLYKLLLIDSKGEIAHTYTVSKDQIVDRRLLLKDTQLQLPPHIEAGSYVLKAEVTYAQNPIKTNVTTFDLAVIQVGDKRRGSFNGLGHPTSPSLTR